MTRDFIDNIERTPTYNVFMQQLERHHQQLGTPLQKEPVLGSRKLDLFKMYRLVIEAGGCEKVSQERGWRKIAQSFDLPRTCTNAAYVFKAIYYKYLQSFEEVYYWKRNPTVAVRPVPAQRPNIPIRSPVQSRLTNTTTTNTPMQSTPFTSHLQAQIYTDPVPMVPRPAPLPETLTARQLYGNGPQSRLLLALKSQLPNEIDWAFNTMIRLSHQSHEPLDISGIPELLDTMLNLVPPLTNEEKSKDLPIGLPRSAEDTERILQVLHILRNLSFLGANKSVLAFNARCKELLRAGIVLPPTESNMEIRQYCLDTVENISTRMILRSSQDKLYLLLQEELFGSDRQGILTAVRALTRLAMNEQNFHSLANPDVRVLQRIWELTLVPDEELVAAVLDYLYQYTGVFEDVALQFPHVVDGDVVRRLVQLLVWPCMDETEMNVMTSDAQGMPSVVTPAEHDLASLPEPARAIAWLRQNYVPDPSAAVSLTNIFLEYQATFRNAGRILSTTEFVNALKNMQPPVSIGIMNIDGTARPIVQGFRKLTSTAPVTSTETTDEMQVDPPAAPSSCRWVGCERTDITDAEMLAKHVREEHGGTPEDTVIACRWMTCTRIFHAPHAYSKFAAHLAVHLAPARAGGVKPTETNSDASTTQPPTNLGPIAEPELIGVPLTASLILRNLARHPDNHPLFQSWEPRLVELMMDPALSRHIASIFNQLHAASEDDPLMTTSSSTY